MKKEFLAAIIALILTVSSAAVITGCGCNNDKKDEKSTTAPATTVESSTEKTTRSNKKATQPSTQKASGANSQSDLAAIALNSYGVSASDGYTASQAGTTNAAEGTYNIVAVYDANGNLCTLVYIHTSGQPIFVGQDVFESNHGGGNANNQDSGDAQDSGNNQDNGGGQDDGGNQSSADNQGGNQSSQGGGNQGGNQGGYGGGGNQGGDGHDYADKGY